MRPRPIGPRASEGSADAVSVATTGASGASIALLKNGYLRTSIRHRSSRPALILLLMV